MSIRTEPEHTEGSSAVTHFIGNDATYLLALLATDIKSTNLRKWFLCQKTNLAKWMMAGDSGDFEPLKHWAGMCHPWYYVTRDVDALLQQSSFELLCRLLDHALVPEDFEHWLLEQSDPLAQALAQRQLAPGGFRPFEHLTGLVATPAE